MMDKDDIPTVMRRLNLPCRFIIKNGSRNNSYEKWLKPFITGDYVRMMKVTDLPFFVSKVRFTTATMTEDQYLLNLVAIPSSPGFLFGRVPGHLHMW